MPDVRSDQEESKRLRRKKSGRWETEEIVEAKRAC